jgi:hypothetical protein
MSRARIAFRDRAAAKNAAIHFGGSFIGCEMPEALAL